MPLTHLTYPFFLCLNGPQDPNGQRDYRPNQFQRAFYRNSHDPKRQ